VSPDAISMKNIVLQYVEVIDIIMDEKPGAELSKEALSQVQSMSARERRKLFRYQKIDKAITMAAKRLSMDRTTLAWSVECYLDWNREPYRPLSKDEEDTILACLLEDEYESLVKSRRKM